MTYQLSERQYAHPDPIPRDHEEAIIFRYHVTFASIIATTETAAAALQDALFYDGAVTNGSFIVLAREATAYKGIWRWHLVLERYGCEEDYHLCYADDGHDGSDAAAIAQLQGEIDQALEEDGDRDDQLVRNVIVHARAAIPENESKLSWKSPQLLQQV